MDATSDWVAVVANETLPLRPGVDVGDWNLVQGAVLVVVIIVGVFVNLFILIAILTSRRLRRRVNDVLCCHLALVGIVWCSVLLPLNVTAALADGWPLHDGRSERGLCDMHGYAQATLMHVMVWTIAILGWNKYRTITTPLQRVSTINRQRMAAIVLPAWAIGITLACGPLVSGSGVGHYGYGPAVVACVYEPSLTTDATLTVASIVYSVATAVVGFLLPVGVTMHSYFRIYTIARWHRKRIAVMSAVVQVITLSVGVPMTRQGLPPEMSQQSQSQSGGNKTPPVEDQVVADPAVTQTRERKTLRNVLAFVVALVLCYAPHYTLLALAPIARRPTYPPYYSVSSLQFPVPVELLSGIVVLASPAVNGFIYGVRNRAMTRSFRRFIRPPTLGERLSRMVSMV